MEATNDIRKMRFAAYYYAVRKGWPEEVADDFAQEAAIEWQAGRKAKTDQLLTDFLRKTYGDTRVKGDRYESSRNKLLRPVAEDSTEVLDLSYQSPDYNDFDNLLRPLTGDARAYFVLAFYWGLTEKEIGAAFGVSESRISQRMKELTRYLRTGKPPAKLKRGRPKGSVKTPALLEDAGLS